jgi:methyl-accepting chemotaxis protein
MLSRLGDISERGVTANIPVLGTGDSGFESRRSDINFMRINLVAIIKRIILFFDKLEDYVREHLSRYPIVYTFIGGIAIVLFWRGVWHTADILQSKGGWLEWLFYEPNNLVITTIILLMTGLFVSYFIGDTILMSGLKRQKKTTEKTEREVEEEETELKAVRSAIKDIKKEVDEIKVMEQEMSSLKEMKKEIDEIKEVVEHKMRD